MRLGITGRTMYERMREALKARSLQPPSTDSFKELLNSYLWNRFRYHMWDEILARPELARIILEANGCEKVFEKPIYRLVTVPEEVRVALCTLCGIGDSLIESVANKKVEIEEQYPLWRPINFHNEMGWHCEICHPKARVRAWITLRSVQTFVEPGFWRKRRGQTRDDADKMRQHPDYRWIYWMFYQTGPEMNSVDAEKFLRDHAIELQMPIKDARIHLKALESYESILFQRCRKECRAIDDWIHNRSPFEKLILAAHGIQCGRWKWNFLEDHFLREADVSVAVARNASGVATSTP